MKAVITGATGAIGVALINKLIQEGNEVLVITRKESKRNVNIPKNENVNIVFSALNELAGLEINGGYDVFYHLAWDGTVGADRNNAKKQCDNVRYTIDAVRLAHRLGCQTFIGVGSQAEYGRVCEPLNSKTATFPENGYGMAKLCAGQLSSLEAKSLGLRHIWVRVLSVYGPYDGMQSVVMSTINKVRNGEPIECTKGEQIWDFLYSEDAANALHLLGKSNLDKKIYVLGSGEGKPLSSYIEEICNMLNAKSKPVFGAIPYSPNQVMFLQADIRELQVDVGWKPTTSFKEGVLKTARYLSTQ